MFGRLVPLGLERTMTWAVTVGMFLVLGLCGVGHSAMIRVSEPTMSFVLTRCRRGVLYVPIKPPCVYIYAG